MAFAALQEARRKNQALFSIVDSEPRSSPGLFELGNLNYLYFSYIVLDRRCLNSAENVQNQ